MTRIELIQELSKEYAQIWNELGSGIVFEDEVNHQSATATVFIQLTKYPMKDEPTKVTGDFQTAEKTLPDKKSEESPVVCPICEKEAKRGVNKFGDPYRACFNCQVFISADGKTKPMKPKQ